MCAKQRIDLEEVDECYGGTEQITILVDNLNTHTPESLYETFQPAKAKQLWDRYGFVFTPKHGSWLNRRTDNIEEVRKEPVACQHHRDNRNSKVNW